MEKLERCERSVMYHKKGCNCTQSVVLSFKDLTGMDERHCLDLCGGFGYGGGMGELCGALIGGIMVINLLLAPSDPEDIAGAKGRTLVKTKEMQKRFMERFSALRCADLLKKKFTPDDTTPAAKALGVTAHCDIMIASVVEIVADMLEEKEKQSV